MVENLPLVIVGGGPAGWSAGMYSARAGLTALLITLPGGGAAASSDFIDNYPGFPDGISGSDLVNKIKEHAERFNLESHFYQVEKVLLEGKLFRILAGDKEWLAQAVIVCTGAKAASLDVPGENELKGRGVSYCATCDGAFFRGKKVSVVGGGDSAVQEALFLSHLASEVTIVHRRDRLRASQHLQKIVFERKNINFAWNSQVQRILGKNKVQGVELFNKISGEMSIIEVDAVFIYVGLKPNSSIVNALVELDTTGAIKTDSMMRTLTPGLFAAGDVRSTPLRQIITASADGAIAALSAHHYLEEG